MAQAQQLPFLAAAIAYYAFLSLVPFFIVAFTITTAVAGQRLADELVLVLDEFLTPEAATLIEQSLMGTSGRGGVTILGLLVLVWGSLRVFRGIDIAFSRVYGIEKMDSLPRQLFNAVIVILGIVSAVTVTVGLSALLPLGIIPFGGLVGTIGLVLVLPVVFFPLYIVFPGVKVSILEATPGAVFAGLGWTALGVGFGIYTTYAGSFQLYGVLGGVLLLLIWFYFGGMILLTGATINAVLAGQYQEPATIEKPLPDRQLQQGGPRAISQRATMSESDGEPDDGDGDETAQPERGASGRTAQPSEASSVTQADLDDLHARIDRFEEEIDDRTVHRKELENDLNRYIRNRVRKGHAHGWGPYLILLYGTIMTLGAFYFLSGGWAVLAMIIVWLSTLGLYTLMVLVGVTMTFAGVPGRLLDLVRRFL